MNQLEFWVNLQTGNLEFQVDFATFVHVAGILNSPAIYIY